MVSFSSRNAPELRRRRRKSPFSTWGCVLPCFLCLLVVLYVGVTVWLFSAPPSSAPSPPADTTDHLRKIREQAAKSRVNEDPKLPKDAPRPHANVFPQGQQGGRMISREKAVGVRVAESPNKAHRGNKKEGTHSQPGSQQGAKTKLEAYISELDEKRKNQADPKETIKPEKKADTTLRAYLEPISQEDWEVKPLPVRTSTAKDLKMVEFPQLKSCANLMEQFPVDDCPNADPFLPWIHDVFPTHDGKFIQFVAQNKRRCHTGKTPEETAILKHQQPQIALFQSVAVKRINQEHNSTRYRLSSHEDADEDGMDTRFICRFKPSMEETLSIHNVHYEFATYRKAGQHTFTKDGVKDIKSLHTSQLIFKCPVPKGLQELVRSGASVQDDFATLFVDVVPIRTPPRYGRPDAFLPPRYKEHRQPAPTDFDPNIEWGTNHTLPRVEDSGRWENIPICKPSLMAYEPTALANKTASTALAQDDAPQKNHRLIACVWASTGYTTRGERFAISDGERRLREWLHFNFLVGFDHVYVYDNSGASEKNSATLQNVTDEFPPEKVTRVVWPSKVCNNRKNNVDSPGERSSQYAAEASCRLRFGPHTEWLGGFDIDEYVVPLGEYTNLKQILDKLESEGNKIISFGSWRAWPRKALIEEPETINDPKICARHKPCFHVRVPANNTLLQTYNCDRQQGQKTQVMPAEKQLYRPDYVKQHFVHFSTITTLSQMSKSETLAAGLGPYRQRIGQDPACRFSNEINEGTMLHTKAVATQDTADWLNACKVGNDKATCRIGNPYPEGAYEAGIHGDPNGWEYNCFVNQRVENYWVPKLEQSMKNISTV